MPSLISGEMLYRKTLLCRPEMLHPSNTLLLSGCFGWGEQRRGKGPRREVFCCPLVICSGPQLCFFSGKRVDRQREVGKVVLLQSYEGLGGLEALSWTAERGTGWRGMSDAALRGPWVLLGQCLGNEATKPLASEVSAWGRLSLLHAGGSWVGGGSLLVPVAAPQEFLVTRRAPRGAAPSRDGREQQLQSTRQLTSSC